MSFAAKTADLRWIGWGSGWIMPTVEVGRHGETGSGASVADEVENLGVAVRRLGGPVFGDFGEQAVLDGIPFGSAGGVMSNGYGEPEAVAELGLKFGLPGAGSGGDGSALRRALPPTSDGLG